jgi:hypothetical protein
MEEEEEHMYQFLKQFGIHVGREWLRACLEYISQELSSTGEGRQTEEQRRERMEQELLNQFLNADLMEIYQNSSPIEKEKEFTLVDHLINDCHAKIIQQTFVLQMNHVRDISRSIEDQLGELDTSNERQIDEEDAENEEYDEQRIIFENSMKKYSGNGSDSRNRINRISRFSSNRMLLLTCTDGKSKINAVEFKRINNLSIDDLQLGCKIAFKGVLVRRGLILLVPGSLEVLGGSLDTLAQPDKTTSEPGSTNISNNTSNNTSISLLESDSDDDIQVNEPPPIPKPFKQIDMNQAKSTPRKRKLPSWFKDE